MRVNAEATLMQSNQKSGSTEAMTVIKFHGHEALKGLVLVASLRSSIGDISDNICAAQVGCRFISSEIITTNQLCKDNTILFERHL
ncbi:hypothetical protein PI124_g21631 [Phytophthora idaei]|nr:hypothetical protein PI125_g22256 [Phytophthora idaei]KAG3130465.1 hypothetical protein PI126_g20493 [Phytophthora idaei]KAG3233290.1 hypothetical protein PI124_g21631 [Phytophthora idaei]